MFPEEIVIEIDTSWCTFLWLCTF